MRSQLARDILMLCLTMPKSPADQQPAWWRWPAKAANAGDKKAAELTSFLQQAKRENLVSSNQHKHKKVSRKKWKQLAKCAFGTSSEKNPTSNGFSLDSGCHLDQGTLDNVDYHDLTILQLLALNALELTAPASDVLLKNRNNNWVQLAGHENSFAPAGPGTIWKKRSESDYEVKAYTTLMAEEGTADLLPKFYRDVEYQGEHFIEIQDLLHNFKNPAIMDIKMGTRTFLESDVVNMKARADLYEKMIKVDPLAPTAEEKESKAITKLRYMQFRENLSSSSTMGFRIEGLKEEGKPPRSDFQLVRTKEDVTQVMRKFIRDQHHIGQQLLDRLRHIRPSFQNSAFFKEHEVIGSSLLLLQDGQHAGVWMIDFAKTVPVPKDVILDHRSTWLLGNHEDGYLYGLDNLIEIMEQCVSDLSTNSGLS